MKIIIGGAGKIGYECARILSLEGHDITVIDEDSELISRISNEMDVICIEGSATNPETLTEAGAVDADLLLATTDLDEANMVCGISARKLGTKHIIARIRDTQYLKQTEFFRDAFGLNVIVNPEYECAMEISRVLRFPSAVRVDAFSKGRLEIVEHKLLPNGLLDGMPVYKLPGATKAKVLISLVERDHQAIIPNGSFVLKAGDKLSITGTDKELRKFFIAAKQYHKPIKSVMIMGGGRISVYLARELLEHGMSVIITERDHERCEELCDLVPKASIIYGDATHSDILQEAGLNTVDAFVALTGEDGDNIITSIYAKKFGIGKIITKVNRQHFSDILTSSGLDSIVNAKDVVSDQLTRYVRAIGYSVDSNMETLYKLADGQAEALEFSISAQCDCINTPLKDMKLKQNVLICAVIRGKECLIADGNTMLLPGDHAVIVAKAGTVKDIDSILDL